jgi:MFS family permease
MPLPRVAIRWWSCDHDDRKFRCQTDTGQADPIPSCMTPLSIRRKRRDTQNNNQNGKQSVLARSKCVFSATSMLACTFGVVMRAASFSPTAVTTLLNAVVMASVIAICFVLGAFIVDKAMSPIRYRNAFWVLSAFVCLAFAACALPLPYAWNVLLGSVSAASSGGLTIILSSTLVPCIPAARRGSLGGIIILGACVGIALSGVILPELLKLAVMEPWIAVLALLLIAGSAL